MRKTLTLELNSPIIAYTSGIIAVLAFSFYSGTGLSLFFFIGMLIMLFAVLFDFGNLFLFCVLLYPSLDIIKYGKTAAALFGYYMLIVFVKYMFTHRIKLNYPLFVHMAFALLTAMIYSQTSIFTQLIRTLALITLFTSMFKENSKYLSKDYIYKVLIATGIGAVCSSIGIIFDFKKVERNYSIAMFSCVIAIILLLSIYTKKSNIKSLLQILLLVGGIISTLSRTATISLLAILIIPICLLGVKGKRTSTIKVLLIVFLVLVLIFTIFSTAIENLIDRFNEEETMVDGNGRTTLWKFYLQEWASTPIRILLGNGLNSTYVQSGMVNSEHNTYIQMLSTTGLLGTITLLATFAVLFKQICMMGKGKMRFHYFVPFICSTICYFGISALYSDAFHFTLLISFLIVRYLKEANESSKAISEINTKQPSNTEIVPV
ncbi:MAG: O-antigen ligase family protein [Clostridia bacterium]|nr:O-antigen ligase family protein [Clostridia bacterium]